jgi:hypothetical protein
MLSYTADSTDERGKPKGRKRMGLVLILLVGLTIVALNGGPSVASAASTDPAVITMLSRSLAASPGPSDSSNVVLSAENVKRAVGARLLLEAGLKSECKFFEKAHFMFGQTHQHAAQRM